MRFWFSLALGLCLSGNAAAQSAFAAFETASAAVLNDPHDLEIGPDGRLYVADKFTHEIVVLDPQTLEIVDRFGDGQLFGVHDISFNPQGVAIVAVTGINAVAIFDFPQGVPTLRNVYSGFPRTEGALAHSNGRFYVMASGVGQLVSFAPGEEAQAVGGHPGAHDVAEAPDGSIWVADNAQRRLVRYSPDLEMLQVLDDPKFGFLGPRYLDVDDFGRLVVADQDAHRVLLIDPMTETLLGVLGDGAPGMGPGKFDDPEGAAVRGSRYYFSDSDNNRIVSYLVATN